MINRRSADKMIYDRKRKEPALIGTELQSRWWRCSLTSQGPVAAGKGVGTALPPRALRLTDTC